MNAPFALTREYIRAVDLHQPDECARIEGFVADRAGALFHRPAWLLAAERGTGQRARGLVAEKGGAINGWLPLSEVHSPIFGRMLASSGFAVGGGVLAERTSAAEALCRAAEELALDLAPLGGEVAAPVGAHGLGEVGAQPALHVGGHQLGSLAAAAEGDRAVPARDEAAHELGGVARRGHRPAALGVIAGRVPEQEDALALG